MLSPVSVSVGLFLVAILAGRVLFDAQLSYTVAIPLYIGIYAIVAMVFRRLREVPPPPEDGADSWPTSGPVGRGGQRLLVFSFATSGLLTLANPFQVVQMIKQTGGNARLRARAPTSTSDATSYVHSTTYHLPFEDEWFVYNGGLDPQTSHSWDVLTQRYAYDFVIVDEALVRHRSQGTALSDYYCYGASVLAAADGEVVKVVNGVRDAPFVGFGVIDFLARDFIGNHVVIRHAEGEFSLSAHLVPGSVAVSPGQQVKRGELIGHCGHSGHSAEPHLHFHLQDGPDFYNALGLPIRFHDVVVDGEPVASILPVRGSRLRQTRGP